MLEMADILRRYADAYLSAYGDRMLSSHKQVIDDIINCRTQAMGGKVYECPDHHEVAYKYHSCMNRNCPKCQNEQAHTWLDKQQQNLIDVPYFLVTFTLPQDLRPIARSNQRLFYELMFQSAWNALKKLAYDPRYIGGLIGALAVLHTWTKTMLYHPHIHFLVPAGAINDDHTIWLPTQHNFLVPVKALSKIFRTMMYNALKHDNPQLVDTIPQQVWFKPWVVHCKSAGNGQAVLKYFAPYVFRIAISNKRIIKLQNDEVTFTYKHPSTKLWIPVKLKVFEFIRRFLQHVLPRGFKKVRHYGLLSSQFKDVLANVQWVLGTVENENHIDNKPKTPCCPICGKEMILIEILPPNRMSMTITIRPP